MDLLGVPNPIVGLHICLVQVPRHSGALTHAGASAGGALDGFEVCPQPNVEGFPLSVGVPSSLAAHLSVLHAEDLRGNLVNIDDLVIDPVNWPFW